MPFEYETASLYGHLKLLLSKEKKTDIENSKLKYLLKGTQYILATFRTSPSSLY